MGIIQWIKGEEPGFFENLSFLFQHGWDPGAYGEFLTEYLFGNGNIEGYYKTLHNIYIPYRNKTSEIDVLLIHEKGIFVIESKNYSGWIFGSAGQKQWTQMLNKQTKYRFYNPIIQNNTHIKALSDYLRIDRAIIKSFIVFSERCELKKIPENTPEYTILRRHNLLRYLRKELEERAAILTPDTIENIYKTLLPMTNVSDEVKQEHIDRIARMKNK